MLGRAGADCICRVKHWLARFAWLARLARGSVLIATVTYDAVTQIAASVYTTLFRSLAANAATAAASQSKVYKYCSNKKFIGKR